MAILSDLGRRLRALSHRSHFKKRYDVINYFARRVGAERYLEIGTANGRCLERVRVANKTGVDPSPGKVSPSWNMVAKTSDAYFADLAASPGAPESFQLVFIDGLHIAEQVLRDIWNSVAVLEPGGAVLLHDCNPPDETSASRDVSLAAKGKWNGDVWKAIAYLRRHHPHVFCRVLDLDSGIGVVVPRGAPLPALDAALEAHAAEWFDSVTYADLDSNREELLGLLPNRAELEQELIGAGL